MLGTRQSDTVKIVSITSPKAFGEGRLVTTWFLNLELLAPGFLALKGSYRQFSKMIVAITCSEIGT
jgi:hypothetical protein